MNDDSAGSRLSGSLTYLVVLRHVLVGQDIAMTVAEHDPQARVIVALTGEDALPLLDEVDRIAVAFVGKGPDAYLASPIAEEVARRGGRVVLMGEDAEAEGPARGFAVLVRPFSTGNILAHLHGKAS